MKEVKVNEEAVRKRDELFIRPKDKWTTIDTMIYGMDKFINLNREKSNEPSEIINKLREQAKKLREKAIKESFDHHYSNNLFYNRLCRDKGVTPDDIKTEKDFTKIPMVPDTFFKEYPSEDPKDVYEWLCRCASVDIGEFDFKGSSLHEFLGWVEDRLEGVVNHSSGTTGKFSIIFRDKVTVQRMGYMLTKRYTEGDVHYVVTGPTNTYLTAGHVAAYGLNWSMILINI